MAAEQVTTVVVLEASALLRSLLARCLAEVPGYRVVVAEATFADLQRQAAELPAPHVVLAGCTATAADLSDADVLEQVRALWPGALVMVMMHSYDRSVVHRVVQARSEGMDCGRSTDFVQLVSHLHQLLTTGVYYPREVITAMAQPAPVESELERIRRVLNNTQVRILDEVCAPDEPIWKVVADRVCRSEGCVEKNASQMLGLLGVRSKPGLVELGRRNGFGQGRYR